MLRLADEQVEPAGAMRRWSGRCLTRCILRRFVGLSVTASVPHESTIRKLARRLGADVIDEITELLIDSAVREKRFAPRAPRDARRATVVDADVRWPSDAALAHDATRMLARQCARVGEIVSDGAQRVRDRSRAACRRLRLIGRTVGRRLGRARRPIARERSRTRSRFSPTSPASLCPSLASVCTPADASPSAGTDRDSLNRHHRAATSAASAVHTRRQLSHAGDPG